MKFVHPEILWALSALAIPVIVHLFNFRRFKRISFSNVAFLKEVQLETQSRNRLRHLLILASRLLALAFLIFAFAQPFIPLDESSSKASVRSVSLYIDNSFSMEAQGEDGTLLDLAKARASEVIAAYQATDRFNVITNDLEGRHQWFYSQEDALELLGEIDLSPTTRKLSEIMERQQELLIREGEGELSSFVFSDLQLNTHDPEAFAPDSTIAVRFVPDIAARSENVYIDSVWFDTPVRLPGQPEVLRIRIRNTAESGRDNVPMRVDVNGRQTAIGSFNVVPGTYTDTALYFTDDLPGIKHCRLNIQDHPVVYDDDWYFSYEVAQQVSVLHISGKPDDRALKNVFGNDPFYRFTSVDERNVDYGSIGTYDLVIVDQLADVPSGLITELAAFMSSGRSVLFIPAADGNRDSWNELLAAGSAPQITGVATLETRVAKLNLEHLIYKGVFDRIPENIDLPKVSKYYTFMTSARSSDEALMSLQSGDHFFFTASNEGGRMFVAAAPLDQSWSSFVQHALFVPTMLRSAELSRPTGEMHVKTGENARIRVPGFAMGSDERFEFRAVDSDLAWIPNHRQVRGGTEVFTGADDIAAGNYALTIGDSTVAALGFNYDRKESELEAHDIETWERTLEEAGWERFSVIESSMESIAKTVEELDEGKRLWDLFLMLAALMLIAEIILIKTRPN
jgi:hypothetical protein